MSEEKSENAEGTQIGKFLIGPCIEADIPGLGSIYAAHHLDTGAPAVVLRGFNATEWQFGGPWDVGFRTAANGVVHVQTYLAPESGTREDLAKMMKLMGQALRRVQHDPRLQAHFDQGRRRGYVWRWRARRFWRSRHGRTTVIIALAVLAVLVSMVIGHVLGTGITVAPEEPRRRDAPAFAE